MNNNVYKNSISKFLKSKDFKISNEIPDLNIFTIISKGDAYKIRSCWKINNSSNSTYVIYYYNSYRLNVVSADLEYRPKLVTSEYLCCYVSLTVSIVDTIIHPLNFADKILNLIFHENIKINHNDKFNTKYVLRSVDKDAILNILTKSFIDSMVLYDDLYIEIKDNKALIYYLRLIQEDDCLTLTKIAEELLTFHNNIT